LNKFNQKRNRFYLRNRNRGIPNLMLYVVLGCAVVYALSMIDPSNLLYSVLCFDRTAILQGQVWRLVTYIFAFSAGGGIMGLLLDALFLYFAYRIGQIIESRKGTLKFNLFYFSGVFLLAAAGMFLRTSVHITQLNTSLLLAFAVLYADAQVLLMYIIPIKAKYVAWVYLILTAVSCLSALSLIPLIPILNFLLFFWDEMPALLPDAWRRQRPRPAAQPRNVNRAQPGPDWASAYQSKTGQKPYHHKCTVCGRTDTEHPHLEFRYCSRCSGYRCYCMEHINQHAHITE